MKKDKLIKVVGWLLFLFASGLFLLQMGYLFVQERFQVEYIDNRIFYIVNIFSMVSLVIAILLLLTFTKKWKMVGTSIVVVFLLTNVVLLVANNKEVKHITSISANFKNILSIKENVKSGEAVYNRSYYGILARPKEKLSHQTDGEFKVKWLANDVAAVTYKATDNTIQQFIGTYGDRGSGNSYYYVGVEIHGIWQGDNIEVISNTEGISVNQNGNTELFEWENIVQYGTLAVVLMKNNEASWTISLNENFNIHSSSIPPAGEISLYKATMDKNEPIMLYYKTANERK